MIYSSWSIDCLGLFPWVDDLRIRFPDIRSPGIHFTRISWNKGLSIIRKKLDATFAGRQAFQQLVIANARRNEYHIPAWWLLELPFNTSSNIPTNHPLFQSLSCTHHFHHRTYLSSSTRRLSCSFCLSGNEKQKINYSTSQCHVD